MKTPLLTGLIQYYKQYHPEQLTQETKAMARIEKMLESYVQQEKILAFSSLLCDYSNEHYHLGIINGFKLCSWLMEELSMTKDEDFLQELLTADLPQYWEYEIKQKKADVFVGEQESRS